MINVYESCRDSNGNTINDRTILLLRDSDINEDGSIRAYTAGLGVSADVSGRIFIVDTFLIDQIDKVKMIDGQLVLKDGETIDEPVLTDLEKQELELEKQLAELRAKKEEKNIE